jgi:uncharacterized membrane protein
MDTIEKGRFEDTNKVFIKPEIYDIRVSQMDSETWSKRIVALLLVKSNESYLRSLVKAITWRLTGSVDTFILSLIITGELKFATGIASTEVLTKIILYWLHERAWNSINWERKVN